MNERIELFKMILRRNVLVRAKFNAGSRYFYSFKKRHPLDKIQQRLTEFITNRDAVTSFTKETRKRRRQLAILLKTRQYKNSDNYIHWVKLDDVYYTVDGMKKAIEEYEIEQILLGDNNEQ